MSGLGCRTRLAFGTRRRNFAKASLGSFKVNPRLRLGLTLNSPRLALYEAELIAVALASNELIWIRKFMIEIGFAIGA